jgi:phosphoribosylformylglycinamidine synthase
MAASRESAGNQDSSAALSRDAATGRLDALLFGETQNRIVVTCQPLDAVKVVERAKLMGVPAMQIGRVGGDQLIVKTAAGEFSVPVTGLHDFWWNSIARAMA